jgi:hypothetical protein
MRALSTLRRCRPGAHLEGDRQQAQRPTPGCRLHEGPRLWDVHLPRGGSSCPPGPQRRRQPAAAPPCRQGVGGRPQQRHARAVLPPRPQRLGKQGGLSSLPQSCQAARARRSLAPLRQPAPQRPALAVGISQRGGQPQLGVRGRCPPPQLQHPALQAARREGLAAGGQRTRLDEKRCRAAGVARWQGPGCSGPPILLPQRREALAWLPGRVARPPADAPADAPAPPARCVGRSTRAAPAAACGARPPAAPGAAGSGRAPPEAPARGRLRGGSAGTPGRRCSVSGEPCHVRRGCCAAGAAAAEHLLLQAAPAAGPLPGRPAHAAPRPRPPSLRRPAVLAPPPAEPAQPQGKHAVAATCGRHAGALPEARAPAASPTWPFLRRSSCSSSSARRRPASACAARLSASLAAAAAACCASPCAARRRSLSSALAAIRSQLASCSREALPRKHDTDSWRASICGQAGGQGAHSTQQYTAPGSLGHRPAAGAACRAQPVPRSLPSCIHKTSRVCGRAAGAEPQTCSVSASPTCVKEARGARARVRGPSAAAPASGLATQHTGPAAAASSPWGRGAGLPCPPGPRLPPAEGRGRPAVAPSAQVPPASTSAGHASSPSARSRAPR